MTTRPLFAPPRHLSTRRRVVVAGGAGFVGSHLCRRLLARGDEVVCVDDFSSGSRRHLVGMAMHPRFRLMPHDVRVPFEIGCDAIVHLAGPRSPRGRAREPLSPLRADVLGALNVLAVAEQNGATVLQASTSEASDEGRRCAETLFGEYRQRFGIDARVARIFPTYGPHLEAGDDRVVSNLVVQALTGEPLTIRGDGSQTCSLCYIDDTIEALVRLLDAPAGTCTPVDIGNPAETAAITLARLVLELAGSDGPIVHAPMHGDVAPRCRPDIARASALLDWSPAVPLREGLARTVSWFRDEDLVSDGR